MSETILHVRTAKFPVSEGEADEVTNGFFGKAFSEHVGAVLRDAGFVVPVIAAEDFGWWVGVKLLGRNVGVVVLREHDRDGMCSYFCSPSTNAERVWSWTRFRYLAMGAEMARVMGTLRAAFEADPELDFRGEITKDEMFAAMPAERFTGEVG